MPSISLEYWSERATLKVNLKPKQRLWILTFHDLRKQEILRSPSHNKLAKKLKDRLQVFTDQELVTLLAADHHKPALQILPDDRAQVLLRHLFESHNKDFPFLERHRQQLSERDAGSFFSELWQQIQRAQAFSFPDEDLIEANQHDIFSVTEQKKELSAFCQLYQQELLSRKLADLITARLFLSRQIKAEGLPDHLVIDQPERLHPLDQSLLQNLAATKSCQVTAVLDQDLLRQDNPERVSLDFVRGPLRLLQNNPHIATLPLKEHHPESHKMVSALFDQGLCGQTINHDGLELWSCHDHREEVVRTVGCIQSLVNDGLSLDAIHIAVPNLDDYSSLIKELFDGAPKLKVALSARRPLSLYPAAVRLKSLMAWIATGTSDSMLACYESLPEDKVPTIDAAELKAFRERHPNFDQLFNDLQDYAAEHEQDLSLPEDSTHTLKVTRLHAATRKAQMAGGNDFQDDWLGPLFISARYWMGSKFESLKWINKVLRDLAALEKSWTQLAPFHDPSLNLEDGITQLRAYFQHQSSPEPKSKLTKEFQHRLDRDHEENEQAHQDILAVLDDILEDERFERDSGWLTEKTRLRGFKTLQALIIQGMNLFERGRDELPDKPTILVSELDEARILRPGRQILFCLGLTAHTAELLTESLHPETSLLSEPRRAREHDPNAALRWTLGLFLRNDQRLILSAPRTENNDEARPTTVLQDLERWREQELLTLKDHSELLTPTKRQRARDNEAKAPKALEQRIKASIQALDSRALPLLTPYDGQLGPLGFDPDKHNEYSPTMLEVLADCPHRHFFSNMLYLQEFPEVKDELPRHEVGTAVHACLEDFWDPDKSPWKNKPITAENFDDACKVMLDVAHDVLDQSGIDWQRGPLRRYDRKTILLGLDHPGDDGPRGMLKAALAYHRDLPFLAGPPFKREMKFGMGDEDPIPITETVAARGIIDRLDLRYDDDGRVHILILDYKTGRGKTMREVEAGKALQIAIYALITKIRFSAMKDMHLRGGVLILNRPNVRPGTGSDALDHPLYGVYREHLAATKKGRSWTCVPEDQEVVEANLDIARTKIDKLDRRVRAGQLWQNRSPSACPYCDYRDICGHDEAILSEKLDNFVEGITNPKDLPEKTPSLTLTRPARRTTRKVSGKGAKLSEEQELAADEQRSVSVSAGAGSGKTFILKTRVSRLIRAGVPVRSILAITFTEKAAGEIRERIEQALGEALDFGLVDGQPLTDQQRDLFVKARAEMASASISTIHGFCHQLITMDPLLSSVPPSLKVVTGPELHDIERAVMRSLFSYRSPVAADLEELLTRGLGVRTLRREIRQRLSRQASVRHLSKAMNRPPKDWDTLLPKLQNELLSQQLLPLEGQLREWSTGAEEWSLSKDGQAYLEDREPREEAFATLLTLSSEALEALDQQDFVGATQKLHQSLQHLNEFNKAVGFRKSKKKLPINWWKDLKDLLENASLSTPTEDFAKEHRAITNAQRFLDVTRKAQDFYQDKKKELGALDFEDLIERAHQMLVAEDLPAPLQKRREALIKKLHERFQHVLVDEFQDTDQRQWEIIQALIQKPQKGQANPPTVFIVGDPKQSIYGWRHSDNRVFDRACDVVESELNGRKVVLADNYRSGKNVLRWINTFFELVFRSEFALRDGQYTRKLIDTAVPPQPMRAASGRPPGSVHVFWIPRVREPDNPYFKDETVDEFLSIARLTETILNGDKRFTVPDHKGPRIGILCRTTRTLRGMGQALDKRAIPYSSSHRAGFFSQPAVMMMETALRALAFEQDDVSLAGLLRGPLLAWTDRDLLEARQAIREAGGGHWTSALRRGDWVKDPRGKRFHELYQRWRHGLEVCSPSSLIRLIVADSGIDIAYARSDRMPSLRNIWRLIEMVEQVESSFMNGVIDLLSWISSQRMTAPEGAALAPADDIPVVLTTIHGSKGLEFPIVILPGLGRRVSQDYDFIEIELPGEQQHSLGLKVTSEEEDFQRVDTVLSALLKQRSHARTRSEEKRLFYVACTRAASHLILPVVAKRSKNFKPNQSNEELRHDLQFARSHRNLITTSAIPDDPENPNSLEFRSHNDSIEINVLKD